jgi:16S rRNA (uracil1498-N3)-methyltransferase
MKSAKSGAAPRLYIHQGLRQGAEIALPEMARAHAAALRLKAGEPVRLFDGSGGEYAAVLVQDGRHLRASIGDFVESSRESPLQVTLAQCLSSGDRMDITLQKATELGVSAIQPLQSSRSIVRLDAERMARRLVHWQNVVISACEQCGRNRIPAVAPTADLAAWLVTHTTPGLRLMLAPEAGVGLKDLRRAPAIMLLVGPEGGLSPEEQKLAEDAGFVGIRLGPRVLRTETAPLAALAALQSMWGDL